jgi:predicted Zn-dependent peptidase
MGVIPYPKLNETLHVRKLSNGLNVFVLPKPGFQKTYATFSTHYGSIDNDFQQEGRERTKVPDGIAHFLEHKMFEEPTGDIFSVFASNGASANAFTSFDRTAYLFSATDHIEDNVTTLLNFVQNPYFTDENVEKEKGIIGQEINMYQDQPDWRLYYGLIEALYHKHPIHIDIAGTIQSISHISKETLYLCYNTFYHPNNMSIFVVGNVDPDTILTLIENNQEAKTFTKLAPIERFFPEEPETVRQAKIRTVLPVSLPKCLIGIKDQPLDGAEANDLLRRELQMKIVLDILFSGSSKIFQKLYDEGLISDNFGHEFNYGVGYAFTVFGGDTKDPDLLTSRLQEEINQILEQGIDQVSFERSRKKKIGAFLRMLNSPEAIANEFTKYAFKGIDLFVILSVYESLTLKEINERLRMHFNWQRMAVSVVESEVK